MVELHWASAAIGCSNWVIGPYRAYRGARFHTILHLEWIFRFIRDLVLYLLGNRYDQTKNTTIKKIAFLGLWDTVAAYGLPVDEMARGVSQWILPLELPDRTFSHEKIERACHALSLDDERTTFHPVLWNEKDAPKEKLSQVWFSGVHSNVGGGYLLQKPKSLLRQCYEDPPVVIGVDCPS